MLSNCVSAATAGLAQGIHCHPEVNRVQLSVAIDFLGTQRHRENFPSDFPVQREARS
jgi:hypothetical protein